MSSGQTASQVSQFLFQALRPDGTKKLGLRAARGEETLADELSRDDLILLKAWKLPLGAPEARGWSLSDEVNLNDQLAILLSRGVPLTEALEVCASVVNPRARQRVERMLEKVAAGSSFSDACQDDGGFDEVTIAVYRAAERTGDLAGAARRLAESARRRKEIASRTITIMIYPAAVAIIGAVIVFGMLAFIVPMLGSQVQELNRDINWFSAAVFGLGNWINANLLLAVSIIGAALIVGVLFRHRVLALFLRFLRMVPAVKRLLLTVETARFFSVMGAMTRSGVPLADALAAANKTISNPTLRTQLEKLRKDLVEGGVLRNLIDNITALPLATRRLLTAAERGGDLDSAFDALSEDLANEVQTRTGRLLAVLEPLIIVALFGVLGPLVLAIAIPMINIRTGA